MPGIKKRQSDAATNALVAAAENGDLEELSQLLDAVDPNSQTVVRFRFKSTNIAQIASMLTQSTLPVQSGNTALRAATALGDADCICVLLNRGANIDLETSRGTALLAASSQGDIDILTLLLSRGANIDYETASGTTALSAAILQHKHAAVELLLAHGAELDHINRDGRTPLQLAQEGSDMHMLALVHQAHVQRAAACALHELESRRDALELEMERQQETDLQEVGHQMADSRQALATKLAELKEQSAGLRQQYVK